MLWLLTHHVKAEKKRLRLFWKERKKKEKEKKVEGVSPREKLTVMDDATGWVGDTVEEGVMGRYGVPGR